MLQELTTVGPGLPLDDIDWGLIVAGLMRFYPGSTPEQWLHTPSYWLQACLDYADPLQAADNLTAVTVGALGAGRVAARNADSIRLAWERSARLLRGPEPEGPPKTMRQTAAEFWLAGLPVEIV